VSSHLPAAPSGPGVPACPQPTPAQPGPTTPWFTEYLPTTSTSPAPDRTTHGPSRKSSAALLHPIKRGNPDHLGAGCVVAANLAERAWTVMNRAEPYVIRDTHSRPVTPAEAKAIINQQSTVPAHLRARRRSKNAGNAPNNVLPGQSRPQSGQRGDLPLTPSSTLAS